MKKYFTVTEFLGDYPIEKQTFWGMRFLDQESAEYVANKLYEDNRLYDHKSDGSHTIDEDYYTLVELREAPDEDLGTAVYSVTSQGYLRGNTLLKFLKKYED